MPRLFFFVVSESYFLRFSLFGIKLCRVSGERLPSRRGSGVTMTFSEEVFRRAAFSGKRDVCLNIIRECVMLDLKKGALRRIVAREKT